MDRRSFFGALATLVVLPAAPRRVYSFLWDNPLVRPVSFVTAEEFILYAGKFDIFQDGKKIGEARNLKMKFVRDAVEAEARRFVLR